MITVITAYCFQPAPYFTQSDNAPAQHAKYESLCNLSRQFSGNVFYLT